MGGFSFCNDLVDPAKVLVDEEADYSGGPDSRAVDGLEPVHGVGVEEDGVFAEGAVFFALHGLWALFAFSMFMIQI